MRNPTQPIQLETTLSQAPDLMSEAMGQEIVMMVLERSAYYRFDEIASEIWTLMATPITVGQICDRMVSKFAVSPQQCQTDVLHFLNEIHDQGLVHIIADRAVNP